MSDLRQLSRFWQIWRVSRRYGLDQFVGRRPKKRFDRPRGERVRLALEELGPVFIKFGQALSTRPDLLPDDIAAELSLLQDAVPPFPGQLAREQVEDSLGQPVGKLFASFDEKPLASASVAQVHAARLHDNPDGTPGMDVVVKVLRPGIEKAVRKDLELLHFLAALAERFAPDADRLHPREVIKEYEKVILDELDLMREAANASQLRRNWLGSELIYHPLVFFDLTRSDVLVMERLYGHNIDEVAALRAEGVNFRELSERGVEIFFRQVFRDNFFHADMHPGNIFVSKENPDNPGYIAIDCAISGSLSNDERYTLARMLQAVLKQNYKSLSNLFITSGWVDADTNNIELENTLRACCEPIFEKPLSEIEFGKLLLYLFQSTRQYGLSLQTSLVLLQKTLIHIEGMGRQIYPELDFWGIAEPYLDNWLTEQFSPLKLKDFIVENKDDLLFKASEVPGIVYEALDELRGYSKNKKSNDKKIEGLEIQISNQKYILRVIGIGIIIVIAIMVMVL